jgi:hypothetical protein
MSLCCISYTDAWSAGHDALTDLEVGAEFCTVGSNSTRLKNMPVGGTVIITAEKDGVRHFTIVSLTKALETCTLWANAGGLTWDYNFTYTPLTGIHKLTPELKVVRDRFCAELSLNPAIMMNSRFCSAKYLPVVTRLVDYINKGMDKS